MEGLVGRECKSLSRVKLTHEADPRETGNEHWSSRVPRAVFECGYVLEEYTFKASNCISKTQSGEVSRSAQSPGEHRAQQQRDHSPCALWSFHLSGWSKHKDNAIVL